MAQFVESFAVEGTYKSFKFTNDFSSTPLVHGDLVAVNDTVGVIFVAKKWSQTTGAAETLDVEWNEEGVLIYNCEKITLAKAAVAINPGDALYWSGVAGDPVTNVWQSGYYWIAICTAVAAAGDARVQADLHGNHVVSLVEAPV